MENETHDSDAATQHGLDKSGTASEESSIFNAIRRSLAEPKPTIKALDALAEVQSPTPPPQPNESLRKAGIAGDIYKVCGEHCGGPAR